MDYIITMVEAVLGARLVIYICATVIVISLCVILGILYYRRRRHDIGDIAL